MFSKGLHCANIESETQLEHSTSLVTHFDCHGGKVWKGLQLHCTVA